MVKGAFICIVCKSLKMDLLSAWWWKVFQSSSKSVFVVESQGKTLVRCLKHKASLWHPQLMFIACRGILHIFLWSPDVSPDIVFAPSKQQNILLFMSMFYPFKTAVFLSSKTLDLVYKNSTKERYSSLNTCTISSNAPKSMPVISFCAALVASS